MELASFTDGWPSLLTAIEQSWLGRVGRSSAWLYPFANVTHVLALLVFAGAVALIDVRLIGGFAAVDPRPLLRGARRVAVAAFLVLAASGAVLFASDADKLGPNSAFLAKMALILLALANVIVFEVLFAREPAHGPGSLPASSRVFGLASIGLWLGVAAAGRLIAYL